MLGFTVFQMYSKYSKVDVAKAIDLELKGDIENCLTAVGKETAMTACHELWPHNVHCSISHRTLGRLLPSITLVHYTVFNST